MGAIRYWEHPMRTCVLLASCLAAACGATVAHAQPVPVQPAPSQPATSRPTYDAALAERVGADERGMRQYVLVILRTGPTRVPAGPERDEMFKGHFANMRRLADAGKLVLAGPLDGVDGWRGLYVFAVTDLEEARRLVATDPVVAKGEMVPELHTYYGTAALMLMPQLAVQVARSPM
jgi:uncharacterized protein YciI